jgi:hypothetical protein
VRKGWRRQCRASQQERAAARDLLTHSLFPCLVRTSE